MNDKRLHDYHKTFQELHILHAKQTVNLRKTVENLNSRIELLEKRINDLE